MSFFSELGAGLRAAAKEYNEIKQEFVSIKDDVTNGVKSVADEAQSLAGGAKQALSDSASTLTGAARTAVDDAKQSASSTVQDAKEKIRGSIGGDKDNVQ